MTRVIENADGSKIVLLEREPDSTCELCGASDGETRPYGPGGKRVCHPCGMAPENAEHLKRAVAALFGDDLAKKIDL